ncbi:hypothetical protein TNCV_568581 [Trichonephila clavipes]|nr:hypothetical protein TNCV_568581 [Trichonephila clavipes]
MLRENFAGEKKILDLQATLLGFMKLGCRIKLIHRFDRHDSYLQVDHQSRFVRSVPILEEAVPLRFGEDCTSRSSWWKKEKDGRSQHPQGVLPQNWSGTEKNRTVTCMVLKSKANNRRKNLALSRDEFRGP